MVRGRKLKGGKILGVGADGCVFSAAAWPCSTPVPGYDPSDPSFVSKIVPVHDNEEDNIMLALTLVPDKSEHLIGYIGKCSPAVSSTEAVKKAQLDENKEEVRKKAEEYEAEAAKNSGARPTSCAKLSVIQDKLWTYDIYADTKRKKYYNTKAIINKRYEQTLRQYLKTHPDDLKALFRAYAEYINVLERLAEGSNGKRLINVDLHPANIFVNSSSGKLVVGIADFGRCMIQLQKENLLKYIVDTLEYCVEYDCVFGFPVVPFEMKLFTYAYARKEIASLTPEAFIAKFANRLELEEHDDFITPFSMLNKDFIELTLKKYFLKFITTLLVVVNIAAADFSDTMKEFVRITVINRFNSLGPLQTLFNAMYHSIPKYKLGNVHNDLKMKMINYLSRDTDFIPANDFEFIAKLWLDTLLLPHKILANVETPTVENYIAAFSGGKPYQFSTRFLAAIDGGSPPRKVSDPLNRGNLTALYGKISPPPTAAATGQPTQPTQQPRYLTRAAVSKNPSLIRHILNPNNRTRRNNSRRNTEAIIKNSKKSSSILSKLGLRKSRKTNKR